MPHSIALVEERKIAYQYAHLVSTGLRTKENLAEKFSGLKVPYHPLFLSHNWLSPPINLSIKR